MFNISGFTIDEINEANMVILCRTQTDANDLMKELHKQGITWNDDSSLLDNSMWHYQKENTYYCFSFSKKLLRGDINDVASKRRRLVYTASSPIALGLSLLDIPDDGNIYRSNPNDGREYRRVGSTIFYRSAGATHSIWSNFIDDFSFSALPSINIELKPTFINPYVVDEGFQSYCIADSLGVITRIKNGYLTRENSYVAGAFKNEHFAKKKFKSESLLRRMEKFAYEYYELFNSEKPLYFLTINAGQVLVNKALTARIPGVIYFPTSEIADEAKEKFGDELIESFNVFQNLCF